MPVTLNNLYNKFKGYVNTQVGGWWKIQTDFTNQCNSISNKLWEHYTGQAEKSQEIKDKLQPFLKSKNVIVKPQKNFGVVKLPDAYGRFATARILVAGDKTKPDIDVEGCSELITDEERTETYYDSLKEKTVELIDIQKWGSCLDHKTKFPTLENPKMTEVEGAFRIAPRNASVVIIDYYVKPTDATFVYTVAPGNIQTGSGDFIIYDSNNSRPLEWPETMIDEFVLELAKRYGTFTQNPLITQSAAQEKMTS